MQSKAVEENRLYRKRKQKRKLLKLGILLGMTGVLLMGCGQNVQTQESAEGALSTPEVLSEENSNPEENVVTSSTENAEEKNKSAELVTVEGCSQKGTELDSVYKKAELMEYSLQIPAIQLVNTDASESVNAFLDCEKEDFQVEKFRLYWDADDTYRGRQQEEEEEMRNWGVLWFYDVSYSITQNDEQYISLLKHEEVYAGGAHGSYILTGNVLDAGTGEELTLDDFLSGKENEKAYLAEYLIEQFAECVEDLWADYDEILTYSIYFDPNFYVEEDKLVFVFNQYELASYAMGPQFAEIPISLLEDLENAVQDKEQALAYAERMNKPESINHYLVEVSAGETVYADLDGDGDEEEILYPEDAIFEETQVQIQIDDMIYQYYVDENIVEEYIGLIDLNEADGKYELAVYAYGPSDDPITVFYRYANDSLHEIGRAENVFDRGEAVAGNYYFFGGGEIYGKKRTYTPLETRFIDVNWILDPQTDDVVFKEQEYYSFASSAYDVWREEFPYYLLDSVVLYSDQSRDVDYMIIEGEGNRITRFYGSDGTSWLHVEILAGEQLYWGWIYVEDWQVETQRDSFTSAEQVIANLSLAG